MAIRCGSTWYSAACTRRNRTAFLQSRMGSTRKGVSKVQDGQHPKRGVQGPVDAGAGVACGGECFAFFADVTAALVASVAMGPDDAWNWGISGCASWQIKIQLLGAARLQVYQVFNDPERLRPRHILRQSVVACALGRLARRRALGACGQRGND